MDVLGATSTTPAHTPTASVYWGVARKEVLAQRLKREVETPYCTGSPHGQVEVKVKMGVLDDEVEQPRPRRWRDRREHHQGGL